MRLLGVDFGFKRIGLAVAERDPFLPTPRPSVDASGTLEKDAVTLADFARKEGVDVIVMGLPVEETGEEGKMARIVRQLGDRLISEGLDVKYVDERYSSVKAVATMREAGLKGSDVRKRKDGEAACLILEDFVNE